MKFDPWTPITCPACGEDNLHQTRIEVFTRKSEDDTEGVHVTAVHDVSKPVTVDTDISDNPSRRRDGITIHFSCEHCYCLPVLRIVQHKGTTYIESAS